MKLHRLDHLVPTVASIDETADFYTGVPGMTLTTFDRSIYVGDPDLNLIEIAPYQH